MSKQQKKKAKKQQKNHRSDTNIELRIIAFRYLLLRIAYELKNNDNDNDRKF